MATLKGIDNLSKIENNQETTKTGEVRQIPMKM